MRGKNKDRPKVTLYKILRRNKKRNEQALLKLYFVEEIC